MRRATQKRSDTEPFLILSHSAHRRLFVRGPSSSLACAGSRGVPIRRHAHPLVHSRRSSGGRAARDESPFAAAERIFEQIAHTVRIGIKSACAVQSTANNSRHIHSETQSERL